MEELGMAYTSKRNILRAIEKVKMHRMNRDNFMCLFMWEKQLIKGGLVGLLNRSRLPSHGPEGWLAGNR